MQASLHEQPTADRGLEITSLPLAIGALQRQVTTFLADHRIDLSTVRQIADGFCIGPITDPAIKTQLAVLKAKGQSCHLGHVVRLNSLGSCLIITDPEICENARLHDFPPLHVAFVHYSQGPKMFEYLRRYILGPLVERRYGKEDLEVHFRLFTAAIGLAETTPANLRVAGYWDTAYGFMAQMYAEPVERTVSYFNLGSAHLIEGGHYSYQLGPDVFAVISFRKTERIGFRLMAVAWCRAAGCERALRDLDRWQKSYDRC